MPTIIPKPGFLTLGKALFLGKALLLIKAVIIAIIIGALVYDMRPGADSFANKSNWINATTRCPNEGQWAKWDLKEKQLWSDQQLYNQLEPYGLNGCYKLRASRS